MTTIEVDPGIKVLLDQVSAVEGPPVESLGPEQARMNYHLMIALDGPGEEVASVADATIAGIPVRVYRPMESDEDATLPTLVWFHGGGFVIGDLDDADPTARKLANRSGCLVVSVDYRRAPESPYPAAAHDCWAVTSALAGGAVEPLGGDPRRLAVGGDSAGGNLAAVTAIRARDAGVKLRHQLLVYPVTDLSMSFPSIDENAEGYLLTKATLQWFYDCYVGSDAPADATASPILAEDLTGVAPAHVITAGFDPLRDEGDAYAEKLAAAGVDVVHDPYPSMTHSFFTMGAVTPVAGDAATKAGKLLRERV